MIVETTTGPVRGSTDAEGISAFLSVPYAAPITLANRFAAPQPVTPWTAPREATRLGPVCPQVPTYGPVGHGAASALAMGEDFLTLNIRTPDVTGRAPVLVWVHGGGYAVGSANEAVQQSGGFAATGVVEVTINYRLGAMGFLSVPGCPENRGLLDQIAALRWVQENIAAFGGDPAQVTFAGRSAGGFSIAAVMAMPASHGLYARAMPQSGASTGLASPADAAKLTARMCAYLGCDAEGLKSVPLERLLIAQRDLCNESYERHDFARDGTATMLGVPFVPVIDGESLPEHPEVAAAAGRVAQVPMMIGCTTAEYLTHSTALPEGTFDYGDAARLLHERCLPLGRSGAEMVALYREALPEHDARGIWRAVAGDLVFQNPATRFALAHAAHQPVLKYLYGTIGPDETGHAHGAEVGPLWYRPGMDQSVLPERRRIDDPAHAAAVHETWRGFIAGTPDPRWPLYTAGDDRLLHLDPARGAEIAIRRDPFAARPGLWNAPIAPAV